MRSGDERKPRRFGDRQGDRKDAVDPFAENCSVAPLVLAGLRRNSILIGAGCSIRHVSIESRGAQRNR